MNNVSIMYLVYLALSVGLTVWVARTLSKAGLVFLVDVFGGNERLAASVNHLLVVGFYLVNLGYVSLALKGDLPPGAPGGFSSQAAIEVLSWKIGLVLLVLGGMHFINVLVFSRIRRRTVLRDAPPPVEPDELLGRRGVAAPLPA